MTKSESKYFNTALIMDEALIELLGKKDIQYISVKEICERAGVNRSTFYLHYETIGDLLNETIEYIVSDFQKSFVMDASKFKESIKEAPLDNLVLTEDEYLKPYLQYVKEHKHVFRAAVNNPGGLQAENQMSTLYKQILKPIFTRFGIPENEQKYWLAYHIHGIMAIVLEWLKNDCAEPIGEIAHVIQDCVRPGKISTYEG